MDLILVIAAYSVFATRFFRDCRQLQCLVPQLYDCFSSETDGVVDVRQPPNFGESRSKPMEDNTYLFRFHDIHLAVCVAG